MRCPHRTARLISNRLALRWLWFGDPGGEPLFLFYLWLRGPELVFVPGWLWLRDPGGEALFLLPCGPRDPRLIFVLGWLWLGDAGGEALFRLHF